MAVQRLWLNINPKVRAQRAKLLERAGLVDDTQIDYAVGIFEGGELVATAALFQNIIKTVAVAPDQQGQDYLAPMIGELLSYLAEQQERHSFVYTKPDQVKFFEAFGFKQVVQTAQVSLLERGTPNIARYQQQLAAKRVDATPASAIVMNANPFTLGHLELVTEASHASGVVYVFVVTEDRSFFNTEERLTMVSRGVAELGNVVVLPTAQYLVSSATFPSYFLKEQADLEVARVQAELDATLFAEKIAPILDITQRWLGEEPFSAVTEVYNQTLSATLSPNIQLQIIPRRAHDGVAISATAVRDAYRADDWTQLKQLVPPTTLEFLKGR